MQKFGILEKENAKSQRVVDINYALVEDVRPPVYTAMKYWGKKPHNIWQQYIDNYTDEVFLDPFSGSGMSAFEAVKCGKKAIALDINPLTSFVIKTMTLPFNKLDFDIIAKQIINDVKNSIEYTSLYAYNRADYPDFVLQNVKYEKDVPYEFSLMTPDKKNRISVKGEDIDFQIIQKSKEMELKYKYPKRQFHSSLSFAKSFLDNVGTDYGKLYTQRNLIILSKIFDEILSISDFIVKHQLLFAFIQTVHLSSKMCVPRSKKTNRDYSTSWGRSAYLYSKKQMEMNPLMLFENNCFGKTSAYSCLSNVERYVGKRIKAVDIATIKNVSNNDFDILYGICDIKKIQDKIPAQFVDFILTDPPYGGLVQYLDLSTIWLSWLELFDNKYSPDFSNEIIINKTKTSNDFMSDMTIGLRNLNTLLKNNGKLILTFNNKSMSVWKSLLIAIKNAGFTIEKVIHQQNKRTGESNVSDPFGTSATDFYIRCIKCTGDIQMSKTSLNIDDIVLHKTKELIINRGEPTPYQILFNGVLAELSMSSSDFTEFDTDFKSLLNKNIGTVFVVSKNIENKAGNFWWLANVAYDKNANTLTNRVDKYIAELFSNNNEIKELELLGSIYKNFPNGLTPQIDILFSLLNKHAKYKKTKWVKREE